MFFQFTCNIHESELNIHVNLPIDKIFHGKNHIGPSLYILQQILTFKKLLNSVKILYGSNQVLGKWLFPTLLQLAASDSFPISSSSALATSGLTSS